MAIANQREHDRGEVEVIVESPIVANLRLVDDQVGELTERFVRHVVIELEFCEAFLEPTLSSQ